MPKYHSSKLISMHICHLGLHVSLTRYLVPHVIFPNEDEASTWIRVTNVYENLGEWSSDMRILRGFQIQVMPLSR